MPEVRARGEFIVQNASDKMRQLPDTAQGWGRCTIDWRCRVRGEGPKTKQIVTRAGLPQIATTASLETFPRHAAVAGSMYNMSKGP